MATENDPPESFPRPIPHSNNPFFQNAPDPISSMDSSGPQADRVQSDQALSAILNEKEPKNTKPKPGFLTTFLNFGLDTTPRRSSEPDFALEKEPWRRDSVAGQSMQSEPGNFAIPLPSIPILSKKPRRPSAIIRNVTEIDNRRKFILKLAKALMSFGAPSHRIESQLVAASKILDAQAEFVHLPNIIIVTIRNGGTASTRTYFVRATGRIALSRLNAVHHVYRKVLHDKLSAEAGTDRLRDLLTAPPVYNLWTRCFFAFTCASILCVLSFGGSFLDMWVSGCCAAVLQYLGLNAANKSSMYANVYEISVTIIVAFVARGLSNIPGNFFCYSAVSSAGVVVILPGFTVLISALELMSKNVFCGSVRIVYAIIYTLFLGFGLTIGSDLYLVVDHRAREAYYSGPATMPTTYTHGVFQMINGTNPGVPFGGVLGLTGRSYESEHIIKGCFRDPSWNWARQPFPWWTMLFLVPLYSTSSSLSNLQSVFTWNSRKQLAIMVFFSCCSYTVNRAISAVLPTRPDIVSASGAFVIGCLGNGYSRLMRGTAFTSMVTGVLFLVPSGIAQGGGLTQTYKSSADQYSSGFSLALRMITVACGVTIGLFVSQVLVYLFGTRKNAAHFAF
ncbi:hypothetical protein B0H16DRAFT_1681312 [Mycena metata]|uniref:DUF1212-domain-containing protein n=1 Tax=Mycena metata TaxID=1033252 RepID=A0AAD7P2Q7_9AGAR|nr:hypothetical protein B0H16DRAFT_1681312 [Mycena metata]